MPRPRRPQRAPSLLRLLLQLLAVSIHGAAAFSTTPTAARTSSRLALLRDLKTAAATTGKGATPFSAQIRTALQEGAGGHRPLTRCELELLLPRDRAPLRALEEEEKEGEQGGSPPPCRSTDKAAKKDLGLALSLRAYEHAVAANHNDVGATLERWRRVVALRQNRVLVPGRAAELYSQLISTLLWAGEADLARQVLQYVGLTAEGVYLPAASSEVCDLNVLCYKVAKQMLDIPLEKWEWDAEGKRRGQPEPLSARDQGEAIAEWHWKQVAPRGGDEELAHYVVDMSLAVLRMALREAKARGRSSLTLRLQAVADPAAPYWGIGQRGLLLPRESLELLAETDAPEVGVVLELQEP
jgi:hypothetical protein